ncbi:aspartate kinase [Apilactobacillus ozensis DSM 23829 = JCM 17196]|uniref:Aspartokinase n=2 Tax=Apilactobacillus ozensis TaxID=866801 RepID=A0A0R2AT19_9LACO|nr:aspartate kinase [Apilactobacillus ozensis DSM 23829 = JCM 17196]
MMKVVKFGGSSLASGPQFEKVINIIKNDSRRQVIVTSAPGKRFPKDTKVTDLLITYAEQVIGKQDYSEVQSDIFNRYREIASYFKLPTENIKELKNIIYRLPQSSYPNDDYLMAAFKAHGERINAKLMNMILNHLDIKSRYIDPKKAGIIVTDYPNNASVLPVTYKNLSELEYSDDEKLVFPGFFGFTSNNEIATFNRGGSDITGSILARGLKIPSYENFTDVNAIYAANPKIVNDPMPIHKLTYREMRELSYAGFSVFNDEAIIPAIEGHVTITVKNTNNPELPGTKIVPQGIAQPSHVITGVAGSDHFSALYIHKYLLNKEVGFTLKLLQILYKYNISYEHMPSGIDDLTVIFDKKQLTDNVVENICQDIKSILNPDQIEWIDDYAIIMIVGEGMKGQTGILDRVLNPLAQNRIAVHMINQGASRLSMMIGTRKEDAEDAVNCIYNEFFLEE